MLQRAAALFQHGSSVLPCSRPFRARWPLLPPPHSCRTFCLRSMSIFTSFSISIASSTADCRGAAKQRRCPRRGSTGAAARRLASRVAGQER